MSKDGEKRLIMINRYKDIKVGEPDSVIKAGSEPACQ